MNTLTYLATTLNLPVDIGWVNEFDWQQVVQRERYGLTGSLILQSAVKAKGRPIVLQGTQDSAWLDRATLETLLAWKAFPGRVMSLVVRGGAARNVVFDHAAGPIQATPVIDYDIPEAADDYVVTLRFIEV